MSFDESTAMHSQGVLDSKNDFEVLDLTPQFIPDMSILKKAYRKISLAVHPDKLLAFKAQVTERRVICVAQ